MTGPVARATEQASAWVYRGIWGVLAALFRVPRDAPNLPVAQGDAAVTFHPAPGFLAYLKFWFWFVLVSFDGFMLIAWIVMAVANPLAATILALPFFLVAVVPDILAYVAIHLRYDTTWYVMTGRSIRIRRGIWTIHEVTITFENVQNVKLHSGPVQRYFGIANVIIETAGAGASHGPHGERSALNVGVIEGIADAPRIRDLIMDRVRASRTTGLGDERAAAMQTSAAPGFTSEHIDVLREIRSLLPGKALGPRP